MDVLGQRMEERSLAHIAFLEVKIRKDRRPELRAAVFMSLQMNYIQIGMNTLDVFRHKSSVALLRLGFTAK